jgi:hypothetical protein
MAAGVYVLTFSSGDTYVGSAACLETRKKQLLTWKDKPSKKLKKAFETFGEPTFSAVVQTRPEDRTFYEYLILARFQPTLNKYKKSTPKLLTQHISPGKKDNHSAGCRAAQNKPEVKANTARRGKTSNFALTASKTVSEFMVEGKWRAVASVKANRSLNLTPAKRSQRTSKTWENAEARRDNMRGDKNPAKKLSVRRKISSNMSGLFHWTVQHKAAHYHGA